MLIRDFYKSIFAPLFLRSRSPRTKTLYLATIKTLEKFLTRPALLADFNDLTINGHLSWLRDNDYAPRTVNKERDNLLAMWRFACRKKYRDEWPDVPREIVPETTPLAWLREEIDTLFQACEGLEGKICGVPAGLWWRSLLMLIWDTGERIGAVKDLEWGAFDTGFRWVNIPAAMRKGKRRDKLFSLGKDTAAKLKELRRYAKSGKVFQWPYTETYLWDRLGVLLKKARLDHDKNSKFHRLRRSVASHYEAAGGDATELLGHSDRRVTRRHYLDPRIVPQQKPACDVLFRPT